MLRSLLVVAVFSAGGLVWVFFMREKPFLIIAGGGLWTIVGVVYTTLNRQPIAVAMLTVGMICLIGGLIRLQKARKAAGQPG